jgi:hypothetical protein|tara:strand:+ start:285 stop:644 length:360 start_codon:yes stop_codon:yes gene_type:complete
MSELILATGTETIAAGMYASYSINTGITDPSFYPVIVVTPFGEYANVNATITTLEHDTYRWKFKILRSIGVPGTGDLGSESQSFFWKIIAVKPIKEIGETVSPAVEAITYSGGSLSESP